MAFDIQHVIMQWGGKLNGPESWTCSLRLARPGGGVGSAVPTQDDLLSWLNGSLKDAVSAYHSRADTYIHPSAKLSFVKANRVGTDGRYLDQSTNEYLYPDIAGGGYATEIHPNQCTIAVSLTTGYTRGAAHRGRFYLPAPATPIEATTGLMPASVATSLAGSTKTFLEAVADVPGLDTPLSLTPCVMSQRSGGAHRPITGVEVGRVVDTQRRRRKSIPERYYATDLDLGAA